MPFHGLRLVRLRDSDDLEVWGFRGLGFRVGFRGLGVTLSRCRVSGPVYVLGLIRDWWLRSWHAVCYPPPRAPRESPGFCCTAWRQLAFRVQVFVKATWRVRGT